jgi:hypothetical protein
VRNRSISVAQALLAGGIVDDSARDRSEHRGRRTTNPRRLAIDSARIDPKRDFTTGYLLVDYRVIR